jgi:hypothetical protein
VTTATAGGRPHRGIVAVGTVLTEPEQLVEPDFLQQYWVDATTNTEPLRRVWIHYQSRLNLPVWLDKDTTGLIGELSVSLATGGTVFRITPEQCIRLEELAGGSAELLDEPIEFDSTTEGRVQFRLHKHRK